MRQRVFYYSETIILIFIIIFIYITLHHKNIPTIDKEFQSSITEDERKLLIETARTFSTALESANIPFMMYSGTLLGSYRHHDLIPWDDDFDVLINSSFKNAMKRFVSKYNKSFGLYVPEYERKPWKYYRKDTSLKTLPEHPFGWPYVDIFFFDENKTHIWDDLPYYSEEFVFRKDKVFPLRRRLFSTLQLYAPCNPRYFLKTYDIHNCRSNIMSHKYEVNIPVSRYKVVPCEELVDIYPFVYRTKTEDGGWKETLKIGETALYFINVKEFC